MNSLAYEYEIPTFSQSPTVLAFGPDFQTGSPAPGIDRKVERARGRGLDLLMVLTAQDSDALNPEITPGVISRFLCALPQTMPEVEAYISPQGSVCFDWDENPKNALSLLLRSPTKVGYAAYFGGERIHGTADLSGAGFPREVYALIHRWHVRNQGVAR